MRYAWNIYESQLRWTHAVQTFGRCALPQIDDRLQINPCESIQSTVEAVQQTSPAVVLWELHEVSQLPILQAVSSLEKNSVSCIQIVAFPINARFDVEQRLEIDLSLQELGVSRTLLHLAELPACLPMIRRFWSRRRQTDRYSVARSIWDRLPWEARASE